MLHINYMIQALIFTLSFFVYALQYCFSCHWLVIGYLSVSDRVQIANIIYSTLFYYNIIYIVTPVYFLGSFLGDYLGKGRIFKTICIIIFINARSNKKVCRYEGERV